MVLTGNSGQNKIINGAITVCEAVAQTFGAEGGNIIIDEQLHPKPTSDGYTVAKNVHISDKEENMGAALIKEIAAGVLKSAGDGTSTACILAQYLILRGKELLDAGVSHVELREGMLHAKEQVFKILDVLSQPVKKENIRNIAYVATNGNSDVADLIQKAYESIEETGIIDVVQTERTESHLEVVPGMKIAKGWLHPRFITNTENYTTEFNNVQILIFDGSITDIEKQVFPAIQICQASQTGLLIICDEINDVSADSLIENKLNRIFQSCVVKNPEYGEKRIQILEDLQAYTGGVIYNPKHSKEFVLGKADRAVISANDCRIERFDPAENLDAYLEQLKSKEEYKRLANLNANTACIYVGGQSPSEITEKFDRVEDAILSVKCALSDGVIAGGGSTFYWISKHISLKSTDRGYKLLIESLAAPYMQLLENAGEIKRRMFRNDSYPQIKEYGEVYNLRSRKIEKLGADGIQDSTKVLKTALENAVSVSIVILSNKGTITV